jgi:hypothetical protein
MATDNIAGLADAIEALRAELATAQNASGKDGLRFRVNDIELTVNAVIIKGGHGGIGWGVLGFGAKVESTATQTLRLSLAPVLDTPDGEVEFKVADSTRTPPRFGADT